MPFVRDATLPQQAQWKCYNPLQSEHELYVPELLVPVSFLIGIPLSYLSNKGGTLKRAPLCRFIYSMFL